jgi:hypothetical protein
MVSGYMTGPSHPPLAASLTQTNVNEVTTKTGTTYYYNVTLSMTTPASTSPTNLHFALNGTAMSNPITGSGIAGKGTLSSTPSIVIIWNSIVGSGTVQSGDYFTIVSNGYSLNGATLTLSIPSAATGSVSTTLLL